MEYIQNNNIIENTIRYNLYKILQDVENVKNNNINTIDISYFIFLFCVKHISFNINIQ